MLDRFPTGTGAENHSQEPVMNRRKSFLDLPLAVKIGTLLALLGVVAATIATLATMRLWNLSD